MSHTESALSGDSGRGPKWDLFRYFLAVARSSSVSGATQVLHESPPTVSRKVRELERHFSASLFSRGPGKLTPTLAGEQLLERLTVIENGMRAINEDLANVRDTLRGRVTITAPRGLGKAVLFQCLGELREALPEIEYTTVFQTKKLNLRNREADIAIRIGDPGDDDMIVKKIGSARFGLFASQTYIDRIGAPATIMDLPKHDFVDLEGGANLKQIVELNNLVPDLSAGLKVDCILLQAHSVALGLGFAPLPRYMANSFPNLVEITPESMTCELDVWILTHPDTNRSACVSATTKQLTQSVQNALLG